MAALPLAKPKMSVDEFLDWVETQPGRHEYWDGEVFAMTGARQNHVIVSLNVAAALKQGLRGSPCRAYMADMAVQTQESSAVLYPDVVVSCHPQDLAAERTLAHPRVVIEVLSDSTAAYDRGGKFAAYRRIPEMQEYVLIDPAARTVEIFRRTEGDNWLLALQDSARGLVLRSLDIELPLDVVFEDLVQIPPTAPAQESPAA